MVQYTDPTKVEAFVTDLNPPRSHTTSGYGAKLPQSYRIKYGTRWHRVYVACYSNSGSAYIIKNRQWLFLDTETEYAIICGLMPSHMV